jgi:hypothetical protein
LRLTDVEAFRAQLLAAVDKHPREDWDARLGAWAAAAVGTYLDSVPVHDLVFHQFETDGSHPDIVVEYLSTLLAQGAAAGVWSVQDSRLTAVYLFNGVHGIVDDILQSRMPVKRPQLIRKVQQLCFRLVGTREQR